MWLISTLTTDLLLVKCSVGIARINLSRKATWRYPAEAMTHADYADNLMLLANISALAESPINSLKQKAGDIIFYENANETIYFKQEGAIFTLNGTSLKRLFQTPRSSKTGDLASDSFKWQSFCERVCLVERGITYLQKIQLAYSKLFNRAYINRT